MEIIFNFLVKYETWIYVLAIIAAALFIWNLIKNWKDLQSSIFGLERETAKRKFNSNLSGLILVGIIVAAEFIMVSVITIKYPSLAILATPTLQIEATPTEELVQIPGISGTIEITPASALSAAGCIPGVLEWVYPKDGDAIKGKVELKGTVNIPDLGFYKYEYKAANDPTWTTIAGGSLPVKESALGGLWQTDSLTPGDYQLQLVALDNQNKVLPACMIAITIMAP
jgi:hypothetical protein